MARQATHTQTSNRTQGPSPIPVTQGPSPIPKPKVQPDGSYMTRSSKLKVQFSSDQLIHKKSTLPSDSFTSLDVDAADAAKSCARTAASAAAGAVGGLPSSRHRFVSGSGGGLGALPAWRGSEGAAVRIVEQEAMGRSRRKKRPQRLGSGSAQWQGPGSERPLHDGGTALTPRRALSACLPRNVLAHPPDRRAPEGRPLLEPRS